MAFNRDTADLREALVDLQIVAVGRKVGEANRRGVIDQLQRRLLRKLHFLDAEDLIGLPPPGQVSRITDGGA